jgi:hypothetical protein
MYLEILYRCVEGSRGDASAGCGRGRHAAERGLFAMSEVVVQADVAGVSSVWILTSSVSSQSSLIVLYRKITRTIQVEAKRASGKGSGGEKRKSRNAGRRLTDQQ